MGRDIPRRRRGRRRQVAPFPRRRFRRPANSRLIAGGCPALHRTRAEGRPLRGLRPSTRSCPRPRPRYCSASRRSRRLARQREYRVAAGAPSVGPRVVIVGFVRLVKTTATATQEMSAHEGGNRVSMLVTMNFFVRLAHRGEPRLSRIWTAILDPAVASSLGFRLARGRGGRLAALGEHALECPRQRGLTQGLRHECAQW
jgi:hypothetical protein